MALSVYQRCPNHLSYTFVLGTVVIVSFGQVGTALAFRLAASGSFVVKAKVLGFVELVVVDLMSKSVSFSLINQTNPFMSIIPSNSPYYPFNLNLTDSYCLFITFSYFTFKASTIN